jgi:crotonobetainyl-CoA:carnitine CoA-transferase CaiB-like acyl-CoA transferase
LAQHDLLDKQLGEWAATVSSTRRCGRSSPSVPAATGRDPRVLSRHPQFVAQGFYEEVDHPSLAHTRRRASRSALRASTAGSLAAPLFGEHNHDVFTRILGLSDDDVTALEEKEVIGNRPKAVAVTAR